MIEMESRSLQNARQYTLKVTLSNIHSLILVSVVYTKFHIEAGNLRPPERLGWVDSALCFLQTLEDGSADTADHITRETTSRMSGNRLALYSSALITFGVVSFAVYSLSKRFPQIRWLPSWSGN